MAVVVSPSAMADRVRAQAGLAAVHRGTQHAQSQLGIPRTWSTATGRHGGNAANLGIMGAAIGIAVYALMFVGLLVIIRKTSPLNVLTKSWASFILYFVIETIALPLVLFWRIAHTV